MDTHQCIPKKEYLLLQLFDLLLALEFEALELVHPLPQINFVAILREYYFPQYYLVDLLLLEVWVLH